MQSTAPLYDSFALSLSAFDFSHVAVWTVQGAEGLLRLNGSFDGCHKGLSVFVSDSIAAEALTSDDMLIR